METGKMIVFIIEPNGELSVQLANAVAKAEEYTKIFVYQDAASALEAANLMIPDVTYINTDIQGADCIETAKTLLELNAQMNIIFISERKDPEIMLKAIGLHCSGFLIMPLNENVIVESIEKMLYKPQLDKRGLYMHTFGYFEFLKDGKPIVFHRKKSKELLALLVDKRGMMLTNRMIATYLYPSKDYGDAVKNQVTTVISDLRATLNDNGVGDVLIKNWGSIGIDKTKFRCDMYDFRIGRGRKRFSGHYMEDYSWAEETKASLFWGILDDI